MFQFGELHTNLNMFGILRDCLELVDRCSAILLIWSYFSNMELFLNISASSPAQRNYERIYFTFQFFIFIQYFIFLSFAFRQ